MVSYSHNSRYITNNLFERRLDSLSDTLREGDMIIVALMQRRSFFTTKSIAKIDFTECEVSIWKIVEN